MCTERLPAVTRSVSSVYIISETKRPRGNERWT